MLQHNFREFHIIRGATPIQQGENGGIVPWKEGKFY